MPPNKRMLTEEQRERKKQRERERYLNMSREQLELKRQRDRIRRRRLKMTEEQQELEEQQDPKQQLELQKQLELKEQRDRDRRWEECRQKALTWTEEELEQKRERIRAKMTAKQLKRLRRRQGARDRPRTEAHAEGQFVGERQAGDVETQEDDSSNSGDTTDAETESILVGGSSILPDLLPPDEEAEESVESDTWLLMMPDAMKTEIKTEERVDDQVDAGMDDDDDNEAPAEIEVEECCPPLQVVVGVVPSALLLVEQLVTSFMKQSIRSGTKRLSEVVPPDLQSTLDENADKTFSVLDLFKTKTQMQALTGVSANVIDCLAQLMTLLLPARLEGKLSIRQRVVMTLTKLRTNMSFDVLGSLFGVDRRTCGKYFSSTIRSLALILRPCIYSPTKEENLMIQKQSETVMLLAMVEISLESTNCSECHSELYVPNNGSSFIKFYTGVVPSGLIIYLSRVHSSIVDNKKILAESDLIPMKLSQPKSDIEIVDDDDDIQIIAESLHQKKVCEENHITMDTPNACREADLLNAKEELNNAVQKMKMFKIWSGKLSTAIAPLIDEILTVIAGLINLTSPLISGECITPVKECAC